MVKRLLFMLIALELGALWFIYQSKEPLEISNAPNKFLSLEIKQQSPHAVNTQVDTIEASTTIEPLSTIKEKYKKSFQLLEEETKGKIKDLVSSIKKEFDEGNGVEVFLSLGSYYTEFKELEKETDAHFEELYSQLEDELEVNGYSKDEGLEFKRLYEEKKKHC